MGYDMPCGSVTPADPKPTPAMVEARIMWVRASRSSGSSIARITYLEPISAALAAQMLLMGLAPW